MPGYVYSSLGTCLFKQSLIENRDDLIPKAYEFFEKSLAAAVTVGNHYLAAWTKIDMAYVLLRQTNTWRTAWELLVESLEYIRVNKIPKAYVRIMEGLASVAAQQGEMTKTVRLLGATESHRAFNGLVESAWFHRWNDRTLYACRVALPEKDFIVFWDEGRELTVEQAIALGTEGLPPKASG